MPDEMLKTVGGDIGLGALLREFELAAGAYAVARHFRREEVEPRRCDLRDARVKLVALVGSLQSQLLAAHADARQELQKDSVRLDWFERNADNLLVRRFDDGTFAFFARPSRDVPFPAIGHEPWQDLRTAIDTALHPAAADPT